MLTGFENIKGAAIFHLNGGDGAVTAKMFMNSACKIMISRLPAGASIGIYKHTGSSEINFVLKAVCEGAEEVLTAGVCQYCPRGVSHSIINTGTKDLILFTAAPQQ